MPQTLEERRAYARAYSARRRKESPEKVKEEYARWRAANLEKDRQRHQAWKKENRAHCTNLESRRRALLLGQFIEDVDRDVVFSMHGGMCGICKQFIDGPFHVDHVIPLSKGGMHGYVNVQPAHPDCNWKKGDRVL